MPRIKQSACSGSNLGLATATFGGKAAKQAKALGKTAEEVATAKQKVSRYYQAPSLGKDEQGKVRK